ncbi:LysR substrate-binding domain-containing protein [Pelagibacterium lentulum]|uniref:LysR family transcriptional regulator n=1 Tax=Pelagibacterium lentulum TaxID=2029865 RepID=A0A916RK42_9HYPH|nr:LysR substrate-binding domain-containing protein [Pelagibacterium lentulum]GGA59070.1 LysR family transcriptional regulator [Pelagibacterium lentulum]
MLNLNDLYLFVQVADHQGFAGASRSLGIPKSTLAKRIADFEETLGIRLFQRNSRRFTITEIGQDLYRHAAAVLIEAEAAEQMLKERLAEPSGSVRITTSATVAQMALTEVLPEVALLYPKIEILLHATDRFVDLAQEGFDIAIRAHYRPLSDSDLVQRRVGTAQNQLVAAPTYLQARSPHRYPEDLEGCDGLLGGASDRALIWSLYNRDGAITEVKPRRRFVSDEPLTLMQAAIAGLGIACLPSGLCAQAISEGRLRRILPDWHAQGATTTILTPHRRGQLPSIRVVVDFLARRLPSQLFG